MLTTTSKICSSCSINVVSSSCSTSVVSSSCSTSVVSSSCSTSVISSSCSTPPRKKACSDIIPDKDVQCPCGWNFAATAYIPWKLEDISILPTSWLLWKELLKVAIVEVMVVKEIALVIAQTVDSLLG
ncbi:hypothetical protein VNO78_15778 [Psophocarpus tetragonolobus]|uniref:Uncharacterized protein n=1 Tax=Psophocarpus tetragonolobus TaxID=3891 RepID=A0AAN9SH31_PSOTE